MARSNDRMDNNITFYIAELDFDIYCIQSNKTIIPISIEKFLCWACMRGCKVMVTEDGKAPNSYTAHTNKKASRQTSTITGPLIVKPGEQT